MAAALHSGVARGSGSTSDRTNPAPGRRRGTDPVRTCVGCRSRAPASGLLRIVVVDGVLTPDPRRRLPGRGAWLHLAQECLDRAERRSAFPRALRVSGPLDVGPVRAHLQAVQRREEEARARSGSVLPGSGVDPS